MNTLKWDKLIILSVYAISNSGDRSSSIIFENWFHQVGNKKTKKPKIDRDEKKGVCLAKGLDPVIELSFGVWWKI